MDFFPTRAHMVFYIPGPYLGTYGFLLQIIFTPEAQVWNFSYPGIYGLLHPRSLPGYKWFFTPNGLYTLGPDMEFFPTWAQMARKLIFQETTSPQLVMKAI